MRSLDAKCKKSIKTENDLNGIEVFDRIVTAEQAPLTRMKRSNVATYEKHPKILKILRLLKDVGLGYLELVQTLATLSGGEGQRLKLAKELIDNGGKNNLYLIDEPTTGPHPIDVENFLVLPNRMVDSGSTVNVAEHNRQVIRASDWIIDLGPEGGINGGRVIAEGTPDKIMSNKSSITGKFI